MALKWQGVVGIGVQSAKGTVATSLPALPICENANVEEVPVWSERSKHQMPDRLEPVKEGFDINMVVDGCEPDPTTFGRIMAYALGAESFAADTHTITPHDVGSVGKYLTCAIDRNVDLGSSNEARRAQDVMISQFSFEVGPRSLGKLSFSGPGLKMAADSSGVAGSVPSVVPLGWTHIVRTNGDFQFDSGSGLSTDDTFQMFKFGMTKTVNPDQFTAADQQPQDHTIGTREFTCEVEKIFASATEFDRFKNQNYFGVLVKFYYDANTSVEIKMPRLMFDANMLDPVGSGEEHIKARIVGKGFWDGTNQIVTVTVEDEVGSAYIT